MPATQHDAWVWVAGGDRTAVFDNSRLVMDALREVADVAREQGRQRRARRGEMPPSAHVARTTIEKDGVEYRIFRRHVAYGGVTDRIHDGLTRWLVPVSGAYYTVPSVESLARFAPPDED